MNIYNEFIQKLEHKNRIHNLLNDDISDKLISNHVRAKSLNSLLSTRPELRENINKIKNKYGYSDNLQEHNAIHQKISELKNKYIRSTSNKYKINQVNLFSYTNKEPKRPKILDFDKIKNISIPNNNIYEQQKISFCLSSDRIIKNITNNEKNNTKDNNIDNSNDKNKMNKKNYNKYFKDIKNEYNLIEHKVNKILEDEELGTEKARNMNSKYPINKRINILNEVKKEINFVNKNLNNNSINNANSNSIFSEISYRSYTSLGFNYIKPKVNKVSLYGENKIRCDDSKNDYSTDEFEQYNKVRIAKPKIIKKGKPNIHVLHFSSFCQINESDNKKKKKK